MHHAQIRSHGIKRTANTQAGLLHDMRVNLRRGHLLVAEQILHCAQIVTVFQKMRGEGMTQGVARCILAEFDAHNSRLHGALPPTGSYMLARAGNPDGCAAELGFVEMTL
jgi:hypothetical protein